MTDKVSRIAIICSIEETIRDEVKRMCDTDSLAELDTMALHAKENIENLRSVKYKTLVKEHTEVVKDLVKDIPQTETQTETENSNLTFENRTMLDCYNCRRYKIDDACVECRYEPIANTQQTESYYTDATHFGKAKGESTTTNTTDTPQREQYYYDVRDFGFKPCGTPQTDCETCKHYGTVSVSCDRCDKSIHSKYEPQTERGR